jgi:hypothetical protein
MKLDSRKLLAHIQILIENIVEIEKAWLQEEKEPDYLKMKY